MIFGRYFQVFVDLLGVFHCHFPIVYWFNRMVLVLSDCLNCFLNVCKTISSSFRRALFLGEVVKVNFLRYLSGRCFFLGHSFSSSPFVSFCHRFLDR